MAGLQMGFMTTYTRDSLAEDDGRKNQEQWREGKDEERNEM